MRDPYLYDDANVLINRAGIKDADLLRKAEADITNLTMTAIYEQKYDIPAVAVTHIRSTSRS